MTSRLKDPSAVVIDGKILMYGQDINGHGVTSDSYSLLVYDIKKNQWQKLKTELYTVPRGRVNWERKPFLTLHDGMCYRICHKLEEPVKVNKRGKTIEKGTWHISQIDLMEDTESLVATSKDLENEIDLKAPEAFCIGGKVFLHIFKQYAYNTGIDASSLTKDMLDKFRSWDRYLKHFESVADVTFNILREDCLPEISDCTEDSFYDFNISSEDEMFGAGGAE